MRSRTHKICKYRSLNCVVGFAFCSLAIFSPCLGHSKNPPLPVLLSTEVAPSFPPRTVPDLFLGPCDSHSFWSIRLIASSFSSLIVFILGPYAFLAGVGYLVFIDSKTRLGTCSWCASSRMAHHLSSRGPHIFAEVAGCVGKVVIVIDVFVVIVDNVSFWNWRRGRGPRCGTVGAFVVDGAAVDHLCVDGVDGDFAFALLVRRAVFLQLTLLFRRAMFSTLRRRGCCFRGRGFAGCPLLVSLGLCHQVLFLVRRRKGV